MNRPTQPLPLHPSLWGRRVDAGRLVFAQGDLVGSLHVVRSGLLRIAVHSPEGRFGVLDVLEAGDVFGETALFGPARSPVEIRAVTECRVTPVPREVWPPDVTERLAGRLSRISESLADTLVLDVETRLVRRLLALSQRHGTPVGDGVRIELALTQTELAAMIGVSRETVNRTVAALVARGRLQVRDRHYTLLGDGARRWAAS